MSLCSLIDHYRSFGHMSKEAPQFENGCTLWSLRFLEVQISGSQTISQEYLDFIQDSNQKRQNQKKSIHRFNRRSQISIRRLNEVSRVWTNSIHRLNRRV